MQHNLSIILPARNEANSLELLLPKIRAVCPDAEIVIVNDGSIDSTAEVAIRNGAIAVSHPVSKGNGAAIKTGARTAKGDVFVFMDADMQHDPQDIPKLLQKLVDGYDMAIGARTKTSHASVGRRLANSFYNLIAGMMAGHPIHDLTSGFRAVKARRFREFLYLLPNGFSYPTTITMAFFRAGYQVAYVPINAGKRIGKSHINIIKDGARFLVIIIKIGTLYSPLKLFAPLSVLFFVLGLANYAYTYSTIGRFTNMSALLLSLAVLIFLIGLVSEQITTLMYKDADKS